MTRLPLDVAHVAGELAELAELREVRPAEVLGRIPGRVVRTGLGRGGELLAGRRLRLQNLVAALHVRVDRLAGDEEVLDLARPFEDAVDAHVAHDPLDRIGLLAARAQRLRRLVAAAAADLHQVIDHLPRHLGVEQLRHRRLEAQVDVAAVRQPRGQPYDRLHGERVRRHPGDLRGHCLVLADRHAPLHALVRPLLRDVGHAPADGRAARGDGQPSGVERDQRELETLPLAPQHVLVRNVEVLEADQRVADAAQPHELAAMDDLESRRVRLHDERRDLLFLLALDDLGRRARHHHDELGLRAVGAPQLLAVDHPPLAVGRAGGGGLHLRGIGADAGLGQRERGDRPFSQAREILLLLLVCAEQLQRLRHADGLMRGEPRHGRAAPRRHQSDGAVVIRGAESEAAVLLGDLHAPGAELFEAFE